MLCASAKSSFRMCICLWPYEYYEDVHGVAYELWYIMPTIQYTRTHTRLAIVISHANDANDTWESNENTWTQDV